MIEITNLSKVYSGREVLNIPHLQFKDGETVGVLGNNGAGKTTLFSIILDLIKPDGGSVKSKGVDVSGSEEWKKFTSAYLDEGFLISFLTPEEYFGFVGELFGRSRDETLEFVKSFEDIFNGEILGRGKLIRDLSKGNQKKVGLIGTLIGKPECVIWDEPFANLDPSTQLKLKSLVIEYSANSTFLVSSHDLHHVYDTCPRIIILEHGRLIKDLRRDDLQLNELIAMFSTEKVEVV
jgi:ABC-2 type transport system ATP-binding protein